MRFLTCVFAAITSVFWIVPVSAQTAASCPVVPSLASSKVDGGEDIGMHLVIWYFNQSPKLLRAVQFRVMMLDAVGNRYPAGNKAVP